MTTETTPNAASAYAKPTNRIVDTEHSIQLDGETLRYRVSCCTVVLRENAESNGNQDGFKPRAELFFTSYTRLDAGDVSQRPITFSFNGGPGSSSVWMHLGLLGPKRVVTDAFGNTPAAPGALIDNEYTLLGVSDLVFIDPIGTGFSRMLDGERVKEYHDYQRDLDSVGEFIRSHLSSQHRWNSPKFIIGESYGTTRAAGLSAYLQDRYQLDVNGLMLISCAMDFSSLRFDAGNDLPYQLFLPTYAATAWFHGRLSAAQQAKTQAEVVREAEAFAQNEYAQILFKGSRMSADEVTAAASKIAHHCGLSAAFVARANLRVGIYRFTKELLRDQGLIVGRLDSRFTAQDRDDAGEITEFDAAHANLQASYSAQINHYLRHDCKFEHDGHYELMQKFYLNWGYKSFEGRYPNAAESLRQAMHRNTHLRVYVASGYTDLATPHMASDYVLNHAITRSKDHERVTVRYFDAGHMMYVNQPDLVKLAGDLKHFVCNTKPS